MKKPLNLGNSIYQKSSSVSGLSVRDGMLINNRPDGRTGIAEAVELKKAIHKSEKVSVMSDAFMVGNMLSGKSDCCG
jgi:hypothetical protein